MAGGRFKGRVAVITASTQGIGYGIAHRLGLEGASVVISSRKQKNVDEAVEKLKAEGVDAIGVACHVSVSEQRKNLIKTAAEMFGKIDFLISNAAANPSVEPIITISEAVLDKLWEVNVKAGILLIQEAVPYLEKGGSVILISSIVAFNPQKTLTMYGVTKTALLGLTKALASELAPNIRVNSVAPGYVHTHLSDALFRNESMKQEMQSRILMDRFGLPSDMGAAVAFLVSDDAAYITGEVLPVSGGMPSRL